MSYSRVHRALRAWRHHGPIVLLYHRVAHPTADPWSLCVTPAHFAEHMELLQRALRPVRLDQLVRQAPGSRLGRAAVAVTFDDGYADNLHAALPVLERHDVPATLFAVSGMIGSPKGFWWDRLAQVLLDDGPLPGRLQLDVEGVRQEWSLLPADGPNERAHREWRYPAPPPNRRAELFLELHEILARSAEASREQLLQQLATWRGGVVADASIPSVLTAAELSQLKDGRLVEIGAHTVNHPRLSALSVHEQEAEIRGSKVGLEALIDSPVELFAYPHGGSRDYTHETMALVRKAGFQIACTSVAGTLRGAHDIHALPRFYIYDCDGDELAAQLSRWVMLARSRPSRDPATLSPLALPQVAGTDSTGDAADTIATPDPNSLRVSVVTIVFNGERFLAEAIESVLAQTYAGWELIIVDDGSTDGSLHIARSYADRHRERVRILRHPGGENRGMSASRNRGIEAARGEYIAFLDADDVYLPGKLEHQVRLLDTHREAGMVYGPTLRWYSWTERAEPGHRDSARRLGVEGGTLVPTRYLVPLFLSAEAETPGTCGVLIRRTAIDRVGGFEDRFRGMFEDQVFFYKLCLHVPVLVDDKCFDRYRQHPESHSHLMARTGTYDAFGGPNSARGFFLKWLESYLDQEGVADARIRQALRSEIWPYRNRLTYALATAGVHAKRARARALAAARSLLPI